MATRSRAQAEVEASLKAVEEAAASPAEKAEMLMEVGMSVQQKPKSIDDLDGALHLYETALATCPAGEALLAARIRARMGTALLARPSEGFEYLDRAREAFESATQVLEVSGTEAELAEAEMNLGLALQNLASVHRARIQDAIAAYQRALRTFDRTAHPKEFAVLQNNLATAFLSIPFSDEKARMREALAVQAFEEGLAVVTLVDHPSEYAMLQNNLGNALQYVSSSHRVENGFRALEAYAEALKVRNPRDTPAEYANTIANKANCLANLPDDPQHPEAGNPANLEAASGLYREALRLFVALGENDKAGAVQEALEGLSSTATEACESATAPH